MSHNPTPPSCSSEASSSSVFTLAERQVLAFLLVHGEQSQPTLCDSAELGLGLSVLRVLQRLSWLRLVEQRSVAREGHWVWDLTRVARTTMQVALEASVVHGMEGARHG